MKQLVIPGFYSWSIFDVERQMDLNGHVWVRPGGNILIDPVDMKADDRAHLDELGGAKLCVITNADHRRETEALQKHFGFDIICHAADAAALELKVARTVQGGEEIVDGMVALHMPHGKTPGE